MATAAPPPRRPQPTHFLSIPLHSIPALATTIPSLADTILADYPSIPPTAIRPLTTLHITICVLSLPTPALISRALSLLSTLPPPPTAITFSLTGLAVMREPAHTSVVYAVPHSTPPDSLQSFASSVRDAFADAGLAVPDDREVKLHATVVNTVYTPRQRARRGGKVVFDARGLLAEFEGVAFAEGVPVGKVQLSRMRAVQERYLVVGERVWGGEGGDEEEGEGEEEEGGGVRLDVIT